VPGSHPDAELRTLERSLERRAFLGLLAGGLASLLGAARGLASAGRAEATTVRVQLKEFKVVPSVRSVGRGRVVFVARNVGKLKHDFVVLRTNLAPGKLPLVGSRAKEVGRQGRTPVFGPGGTRRLALDLKPGKYVLICNVPGHYQAGMRVGFTVR
jgi:uncharacterized cupredoxin-like copper-binding protein